MTIKITVNKAALDRVADLLKQMSEAADAVGRAADTVKSSRAHNPPNARSWRATSFRYLSA
jgi:hypothetical protein